MGMFDRGVSPEDVPLVVLPADVLHCGGLGDVLDGLLGDVLDDVPGDMLTDMFVLLTILQGRMWGSAPV